LLFLGHPPWPRFHSPIPPESFSTFKPAAYQEQSVHAMLDQLLAWGGALKAIRETPRAEAREAVAA
jgi:hypothetical protein